MAASIKIDKLENAVAQALGTDNNMARQAFRIIAKREVLEELEQEEQEADEHELQANLQAYFPDVEADTDTVPATDAASSGDAPAANAALAPPLLLAHDPRLSKYGKVPRVRPNGSVAKTISDPVADVPLKASVKRHLMKTESWPADSCRKKQKAWTGIRPPAEKTGTGVNAAPPADTPRATAVSAFPKPKPMPAPKPMPTSKVRYPWRQPTIQQARGKLQGKPSPSTIPPWRQVHDDPSSKRSPNYADLPAPPPPPPPLPPSPPSAPQLPSSPSSGEVPPPPPPPADQPPRKPKATQHKRQVIAARCQRRGCRENREDWDCVYCAKCCPRHPNYSAVVCKPHFDYPFRCQEPSKWCLGFRPMNDSCCWNLCGDCCKSLIRDTGIRCRRHSEDGDLQSTLPKSMNKKRGFRTERPHPDRDWS